MKTQKLIVIVAIVCLLVGASGGAAMAQCPGGLILNQTLESLFVSGDPCTIINSTINGDVRIRNSNEVLMLNNRVGGLVRIRGSRYALVYKNKVFGGRLVLRDNDTANVIENETLADDIRVIGNTGAVVTKNIAAGDIICRENTKLDVAVNSAAGEDNCDE